MPDFKACPNVLSEVSPALHPNMRIPVLQQRWVLGYAVAPTFPRGDLLLHLFENCYMKWPKGH